MGFPVLRIEFVVPAATSEVSIFTHVPPFDGRALSFANYEGKVIPRSRISTLDPAKRAAHLFLNMADVACEVSMTGGEDCV